MLCRRSRRLTDRLERRRRDRRGARLRAPAARCRRVGARSRVLQCSSAQRAIGRCYGGRVGRPWRTPSEPKRARSAPPRRRQGAVGDRARRELRGNGACAGAYPPVQRRAHLQECVAGRAREVARIETQRELARELRQAQPLVGRADARDLGPCAGEQLLLLGSARSWCRARRRYARARIGVELVEPRRRRGRQVRLRRRASARRAAARAGSPVASVRAASAVVKPCASRIRPGAKVCVPTGPTRPRGRPPASSAGRRRAG